MHLLQSQQAYTEYSVSGSFVSDPNSDISINGNGNRNGNGNFILTEMESKNGI